MLAKWEEALEKGVPPEQIEAIWDDAIDKSAVSISETLKKNGPQMLGEHAAIREGFEQRLQERWKPALDLFEMVLVACTEAGSDLHHSLHEEGGPISDHPIKLYAMTLLHARACLVANEVFALLRTGFAVGHKPDGERFMRSRLLPLSFVKTMRIWRTAFLCTGSLNGGRKPSATKRTAKH